MQKKTLASDNQGTTSKRSRVNPLGITSLALSIIALSLAMYSSSIINKLESRKIPARQYEPGDASIVTDKAGNAITFVEQVVVFAAGGLVCGTLALVGLIIGLVGIVRPSRIPGVIGILLSLMALNTLFS